MARGRAEAPGRAPARSGGAPGRSAGPPARSAAAPPRDRRLRTALVTAGLTAWFAAALYLAAALSVTHLATYAAPDRRTRLEQFADARRVGAGDRLLVLHVIGESCSCTDGLFRALIGRGSLAGVEEHILFMDPRPRRAARARRAGFVFDRLDRAIALDALGLSAAPVMIVLDGSGHLRYAGGYFDHPAAAVSLDRRILGALIDDASALPAPLPIFGCALDPVLRRRVDPLGLTR